MRSLELGKLALGSIRRTPLRVTLTVIGVIIASGALITMLGFGIGLQRSIEEPFHQLDLASRIEVRMPGDEGNRRGPPRPDRDEAEELPSRITPAPLDAEVLASFASIRGVRLVYPEIRVEHVKLRLGEKDASTTALGAPPGLSEYAFVEEALLAGEFLRTRSGNDVVLGVGLAEQLGFDDPAAAIGTTIQAVSRGLVPGADGTLEWKQAELDLRIVAVMRGIGIGSRMGRNTALFPLDTAEGLPGARLREVVRQFEGDAPAPADGYRTAIVRVEGISWLDPVEQALRARGYRTENTLTQIDQLRKAFFIFDTLLGLLGAVALLIASLGIVNTQLMSVLERTKEIAIYKAIGASNGDVRTIFLAEAAVVGLLGGIGGVLLALGTAQLLGFFVNAYVRSQGLEEQLLVFAFPPWLVSTAIVFTIGVSIVSGLYPAARAARVDPIHALRGE